jgi:hypothetical protein
MHYFKRNNIQGIRTAMFRTIYYFILKVLLGVEENQRIVAYVITGCDLMEIRDRHPLIVQAPNTHICFYRKKIQ